MRGFVWPFSGWAIDGTNGMENEMSDIHLTENNPGFANWMNKVDAAIMKRCGMESADLPDCDYWMNYENGTSPSRMATIAIREAGGY